VLIAVFVGGIGTAQAAVVTNYYEDFTGTVSNVVSTVGGGEAMTNGVPYNTWFLGADGNTFSAAYTNAPTLSFFTKKDDSGAAYYTLPSATLGEATSMALTVDLSLLSADKFHLVVYGVDNPVVTTNDFVTYDALKRAPGGFERSDFGLFASGSAVVTQLISSTEYAATGLITTAYFDYNGTDDVVIGLTAEMAGNSKKYAEVNSVLLFSDDNPTFPAELTLVAEDLAVGSDNDVANGSVEVSYTEGSAATNVVITGVSVIDQTHSNAFSNATSLPLTLNDPSPSNDTLSIVFDNGVAGLAVGESATGVVQVVWNEVGSASSSTSSVPISATYTEVNDNNIVAVFDSAFNVPDRVLDGVVAQVSGGSKRSGLGCSDGTYGSLSGAPTSYDGSRRVSVTNGLVISVVMTNNTLGHITFDTLHFDAARDNFGGARDILVEIFGDVTASTLTNHTSGLIRVSGGEGDYQDFDLTLTNLADHVLAPGEATQIDFTFSGQVNDGTRSMIDNIAVLMATETESAFEQWANGAGLTQGVNDDPADNPDGDSSDNLMEYATNGDPLTPDAAAATWQSEETGTNWFYHVYDRRTDDASLTISLGLSADLVNDTVWGDTGLEPAGESAESGGFKSVTNRTDIGTAEFIRLQVEQD
jgi:hypothetical protein